MYVMHLFIYSFFLLFNNYQSWNGKFDNWITHFYFLLNDAPIFQFSTQIKSGPKTEPKLPIFSLFQCEGQLDWLTVDKSNHTANVTLPTENVYQFAVAANTLDYRSGMSWATCTILHNKVVGKLKTVTVDVVTKHSMVVRWRLDCTDR